MINRWILVFYLLFCVCCLDAQSYRFHIDGKIDSRYNGALVTLFTFTGNVIRTVDSTYVKNGCFNFEGPEYLYEKSLVSIGNYPDTVLYAELLLEQGPIEIEMKHNKSIVRSPLQTEYQQFKDSCSILLQEAESGEQEQQSSATAFNRFFSYRFQFKKKHIHNAMGRDLFLSDVQYRDDPYFIDLYKQLSDRDKSRADVKAEYEYWEKRA